MSYEPTEIYFEKHTVAELKELISKLPDNYRIMVGGQTDCVNLSSYMLINDQLKEVILY
ncbi:MAG: hypothetical protein P4L79_10350 [Legionella sp.]|uniref:hypothetical protein n=1 Tax=Legionella sp. TaxID=459 RepID=UPI00284C79FC|nr:hypothetical protein [Legionella sp.]